MAGQRLALRWGEGSVRELDGELLSIGRASEAALCFPQDPLLSREHARIAREGAGWTVLDLGSTNGTFVDSERITRPTPLRARCLLQVGSQTFEVVALEAEARTSPSAGGIDAYAVLDVDPDAAPDEIRANYRRLALIYHPDRNQGPQEALAARRMAEINEAHALLRDPEARRRYDAQRAAPAASRDEEIAQVALDATMPMYETLRARKDSFVDAFTGGLDDARKATERQLGEIALRWPDTEAAVRALVQLAWLHLWFGDHGLALDAAERLARYGGEATLVAAILMAHAQVMARAPQSALRLLDALKRERLPDDLRVDALWLEGTILEASSPSEAMEPFLQIVRSFPDHERAPKALFRVARVLDSELRDYPSAVGLYREVLRLYPGSDEARDCPWRIDHLRERRGVR